MMVGNLTGFSGATTLPYITPEVIEIKESLPKENKEVQVEIQVERSVTVEEYVRNYFSDIPILIEVARCESRFRQHDGDGGVLRGEKNTLDRGVMQINEYYHNENSEKLGFDILTLEGNTAYARYLFEKYGVKPWKPSSGCWGKTVAYFEFIKLAMYNGK